MFTGIIEEVGTVTAVRRGARSAVLTIRAEIVLDDLAIGDSVAVDGVCLTVTSLTVDGFTADVMHETLDRSALAGLKPGRRVDLERAMRAGGRFGGHIVSGHVDGVGRIVHIQRDDNAVWYTIEAAPSILRYVVEKGSIAVDGISLTVARVSDRSFSVSAIPHTVSATTLRERRIGDRVDLENDVIGKYVERLLTLPAAEEPSAGNSGIDRDFLARYGF
ncbi:riboflavin synthase [Pseudoflavonifractor sp. MSJ-37]|uniref:riboflavin synthase n=1 Tax=Pseudoflavonifractor sp. MSJ-37 TaxID=2841531 RepID=UPI001C10B1CC|nr:riboflavin synthase [Pseudoflavonifractor sp. MSJ-37]MBU5434274.1 riboflavin synthase [Pseudoflavonifractor sp. MSJ-37]